VRTGEARTVLELHGALWRHESAVERPEALLFDTDERLLIRVPSVKALVSY
jgi:hypothetical protein